jgi:hypothetical protein
MAQFLSYTRQLFFFLRLFTSPCASTFWFWNQAVWDYGISRFLGPVWVVFWTQSSSFDDQLRHRFRWLSKSEVLEVPHVNGRSYWWAESMTSWNDVQHHECWPVSYGPLRMFMLIFRSHLSTNLITPALVNKLQPCFITCQRNLELRYYPTLQSRYIWWWPLLIQLDETSNVMSSWRRTLKYLHICENICAVS